MGQYQNASYCKKCGANIKEECICNPSSSTDSSRKKLTIKKSKIETTLIELIKFTCFLLIGYMAGMRWEESREWIILDLKVQRVNQLEQSLRDANKDYIKDKEEIKSLESENKLLRSSLEMEKNYNNEYKNLTTYYYLTQVNYRKVCIDYQSTNGCHLIMKPLKEITTPIWKDDYERSLNKPPLLNSSCNNCTWTNPRK